MNVGSSRLLFRSPSSKVISSRFARSSFFLLFRLCHARFEALCRLLKPSSVVAVTLEARFGDRTMALSAYLTQAPGYSTQGVCFRSAFISGFGLAIEDDGNCNGNAQPPVYVSCLCQEDGAKVQYWITQYFSDRAMCDVGITTALLSCYSTFCEKATRDAVIVSNGNVASTSMKGSCIFIKLMKCSSSDRSFNIDRRRFGREDKQHITSNYQSVHGRHQFVTLIHILGHSLDFYDTCTVCFGNPNAFKRWFKY